MSTNLYATYLALDGADKRLAAVGLYFVASSIDRYPLWSEQERSHDMSSDGLPLAMLYPAVTVRDVHCEDGFPLGTKDGDEQEQRIHKLLAKYPDFVRLDESDGWVSLFYEQYNGIGVRIILCKKKKAM